jgi:hypothetical protein
MLSKHYTYLLKGSNIPNLFYSPIIDGVCLDKRLNSDNSILVLLSEENLIRLTENDNETDLIKIKSLVFIKELLAKYNLMRYNADILERNDKWVGLGRKTLELSFGTRDVNRIIEYLVRLDAIECDGLYSVSNGKALSYRLTPRMSQNPERWRVKYTGKIVDHANNKDLEVKMSTDENYFNKKIYENVKLASFAESPEILAQKFGGKDFFAAFAHFTDIEDKKIFFKEDKNSGRRFHNFTCIPRESRQAILIDGEPTTEVDFSACHPWLCLSLYESGFEDEKKSYHAALNEGFYKFLAKKLNSDISSDNKYQEFKIGCIAQIFYDYPRQNNSSKLITNLTKENDNFTNGFVVPLLYMITDITLLFGILIIIIFLKLYNVTFVILCILLFGYLFIRTVNKYIIQWGKDRQTHQYRSP